MSRLGVSARGALVAALLLAVPAATMPASADPADPPGRAAAVVSAPTALRSVVAQGRKAITVRWGAPARTGDVAVLGYRVLVRGHTVATTDADARSFTITADLVSGGLRLGRTYSVGVRAYGDGVTGAAATRRQLLYIAPVTTAQTANPDNPLAGMDWGTSGLHDWSKLPLRKRDRYATIGVVNKAKFFGTWIPDGQAKKKTRQYIQLSQDGDRSRMTFMTLFRMDPWEDKSDIRKRLPTAKEQRSYYRYIRAVAAGIGRNPVTVVLQPDGLFVKDAYRNLKKKYGAKRALLPTRMLTWTVRKLNQQPHVTVYVDMGSEDWVRGKVGVVAHWLSISGVKYAEGFSLNVSHKNYLAREVVFAGKVSQRLARMGIKGKHAVLDTSDNGHAFSGAELNGRGSRYTPPGAVKPCRTKGQKSLCTALGVPPTTDVDNPHWGLSPSVGAVAAKYVDAYLWVSRPWLPNQGTGGADFSAKYAGLLQKTWEFSPYFTGTP